jgi:hypothetical protein
MTMTETKPELNRQDLKKGSSAAKFFDKAVEEGWELQTDLTGWTITLTANDPSVTEDADRGIVSQVVGKFDHDENDKFWSGHYTVVERYGKDGTGQFRTKTGGWKNDMKISELLGALHNGPLRRAANLAARLESERQESERKAAAKAALHLAAETKEMRQVIARTASELEYETRNLVRNLETLQGDIAKALTAIEKGYQTDTFGGSLFHSQALIESISGAMKRNGLIMQKVGHDYLFGTAE